MRNFVQANPCWLVLKTTQMWILTLILTANQFNFDGSWNKVVAYKIWFTACNGQILEIVVRLAIKVCIHWILNIHVALLQSEVMLFLCVQSFMPWKFHDLYNVYKRNIIYYLLSTKINLTVSVVPNIEFIYFVQHSMELHKLLPCSFYLHYFKNIPHTFLLEKSTSLGV